MSNVITANNLTLSYDNEEVIIKNANFSIKKGDFVISVKHMLKMFTMECTLLAVNKMGASCCMFKMV